MAINSSYPSMLFPLQCDFVAVYTRDDLIPHPLYLDCSCLLTPTGVLQHSSILMLIIWHYGQNPRLKGHDLQKTTLSFTYQLQVGSSSHLHFWPTSYKYEGFPWTLRFSNSLVWLLNSRKLYTCNDSLLWRIQFRTSQMKRHKRRSLGGIWTQHFHNFSL